ncbi:DUF4893 domain-containing protein [Devosia sp.]|uniref:DUF4893 domain-containing protein n=1 Tax=Devosia sp. TaxID=1871048 RepID=UPI003A902309
MKRLIATALLLALTSTTAIAQTRSCDVGADVELSSDDEARFANFFASRSKGLAEALTADSAEDRRLVSGLMAPDRAVAEGLPDGAYRCRTIKLGGLLPLTPYGWFACTIGEGGTTIEKTSGSQRFSGALYPADGALAYVGASHYADEAPRAYGDDPERDQIGCLYGVAGDTPRYVLELPSPHFESVHDLIVLEPAE